MAQIWGQHYRMTEREYKLKKDNLRLLYENGEISQAEYEEERAILRTKYEEDNFYPNGRC